MCATFRAMSCDEKQSNKVGNATSKIVYIFGSRLSFQAIKQKKKIIETLPTNTLQGHLIKYLI